MRSSYFLWLWLFTQKQLWLLYYSPENGFSSPELQELLPKLELVPCQTGHNTWKHISLYITQTCTCVRTHINTDTHKFCIHGAHILFFCHNLQVLYHDSMYAACSFHAILTQAIEQLRYRWYYACLRPTSHGLQGHLHFALCPSPFVVPPICLIFGRLCARSCESKESHSFMCWCT
jgi:hypothetical protein